MKKIYLIVFSLILYLGGFAQNSFPTSNAIWNYKVSGENSLTSMSATKTLYLTICGDTIVDSYNYNKLYNTFDTIICGNYLEELIGGFRQDGQKVYFIPYNKEYSIYPAYFGEEFLLYDFGVSIGDTVHINYNFRYYLFTKQYDFDFHEAKTLTVSNIEIEDGIKKIYIGNDFDIWYEGIGSPFGLFNAGRIDILDGYSFGFSLRCFKHNDTIKYINNPECGECFCEAFVNKEEKTITKELLEIYPNPAKDILNIKVSESEKIKTISIRSIDGKLIEKHQEALTKLNISNLKAGAYIVEIETNRGNFNKLVIKE